MRECARDHVQRWRSITTARGCRFRVALSPCAAIASVLPSLGLSFAVFLLRAPPSLATSTPTVCPRPLNKHLDLHLNGQPHLPKPKTTKLNTTHLPASPNTSCLCCAWGSPPRESRRRRRNQISSLLVDADVDADEGRRFRRPLR